jgi:polysaccharide export outer membrane protein
MPSWIGRSKRLLSWQVVVLVACNVSVTHLYSRQESIATIVAPRVATPASETSAVTLGPDDQILIRALGVDEIDGRLARIDLQGYVDVPLAGKIKAAGLTIGQLEAEVATELRKYVRDPRITATLAEHRSEPISVFGAVNTPGVYNTAGPTTLIEILSKAGGLRIDAGNSIEITRVGSRAPIPLPSSKADSSGRFYTAEVDVKSLLEAKNPRQNVLVKPGDVISVPRADLVYVVGAVRKPGGFVLSERSNMTVLEAVAMAEGMEKTAAPGRAKIIRGGTTTARVEIGVNLSKITSGKSADVPLLANDILIVPGSGAKVAFYRSMEAALQAGIGIAVYRR